MKKSWWFFAVALYLAIATTVSAGGWPGYTQNGATASSGGGSAGFDAVTSGTNTVAAMVVGTGGSLATSGSGTITANALSGVAASALSNGTTGTGAIMLAASPTFTGTMNGGTLTLTGNITAANLTPSGTLTDGKLFKYTSSTGQADATVTYTNANTASAVVQRDGSGNFTAGTITAALTGTASGNTVTVASGTSTLATAQISANSCATVVTTGATGTATTDTINVTPNADISGIVGFGVLSTDGLKIYPYPTANNVNFHVCNGTGTAITPGSAVVLNWKVTR